jgi:hypothetical protein
MQSFVLIVLEAFLTFLMQSDRQSKKLAQNLIQRQALVELRTTTPALVIYVTFTARGVLLDRKQPARPIDAVVTGSLKDLIYGFFTASAASLRRIGIDGPIDLIEELRILMNSFNLQEMINHWIQSDWFKSLLLQSKNVDENGDVIDNGSRASRRQRELMKKLDEQQLLVDRMSIQSKEHVFVITQLHRQIKMLIVMGFVFCGVLAAALIGTLVYFLK